MTTDTASTTLETTIPGTGKPRSAEAAAILRAAEEFARTHDQSVLIPLLGTFEDMLSDEEFERMRSES
jgi:hypothetical protein